MNKTDELRNIIAEAFKKQYKNYMLEEVCKKYNIYPDANKVSPGTSKRLYVLDGLQKMSEGEVFNVARQIIQDFEDIDLIKQLEPYFDDDIFVFSHITRRKVVEFIEEKNNMEGNLRIDDFLSHIWELGIIYDLQSGMTVADDIIYNQQHHLSTYKQLLTSRLEIQYISDSKFIKFVEWLVHPEVRVGAEQKEYVKGLNAILLTDGYQLQIVGNVSGYSKYKVLKINLAQRNLKNLIFAAIGSKPDIVIDDTLENGIKIIGNTDNCLKYDFEEKADGLQWLTLVDWWKKYSDESNVEKNLYDRLCESLDSDIEKFFFREYYRIYRNAEKKDIPALIPQVYLHYDPRSRYQRGNNVIFTHQRMDFLMLLPKGIRVVIELDGQQHYAEGNAASPQKYAEMVKDTRNLQIKGYQVFRFGGYEFMQTQNPRAMIKDFFEKLFQTFEFII